MASLYYEVPAVLTADGSRADAIVPFQPPPFLENRRCYLVVKDWSWQPQEYPGDTLTPAPIYLPFFQFRLECDLPQGQSQSCRFNSSSNSLSIGQRNVPLGQFRVYYQHRDNTDATKDLICNAESISSGPVEVFIPSGLQQIKFSVLPSMLTPAVASNPSLVLGGAVKGWLSVQLSITTEERN